MKIFIVGAGEVGTHLAKMLSKEEHDIILMDEKSTALEFAYDNNLEIMPIVGNPTSKQQLEMAGVEGSELFVAVLPEESRNLIACMLATQIGAHKAIARVSNSEYQSPENREYFGSLGVDDMVCPEALASKEIAAGLMIPWTRQYWSFFGGKLEMLAVQVLASSPLIDRPLLELKEHNEKYFHIVAILRDDETIIPTGQDVVKEDDIVFATTAPEHREQLRKSCGQEDVEVRRVIIMGGSRIAVRTARLLPSDWSIKIIERNYEKCVRLSEIVPENTLIIHGDGRDPELLRLEGLTKSQAFLALTSNSESNMLATLNAKRMGVYRSVAQIENIDYLDIAYQMGIGNLINRKLIAASSIFRYLLNADVTNAKTLTIGQNDILEVTIQEGSRLTKKPVKDLRLPRGVTFGGMMRDQEVCLVEGDTHFRAGDVVMVFSAQLSADALAKIIGK
ncbi:MAG: Trk system potassium transporter TrkA [Porphyromonas sp.]|nr:Trk system potassium transporter TrkA [Porphyromonas sp.]